MPFYTNLLEAALGIKVMMISYGFLRHNHGFGLKSSDKEFIYALLGIATYNYLVERDSINVISDTVKKIIKIRNEK
jgi:hypothetical protein